MSKERVAKIVCDQLGVDPKVLHDETDLERDLGADSLDAVELILEIEDEYDIMIPDEEAEKVRTFGQLVALVDEKLAA